MDLNELDSLRESNRLEAKTAKGGIPNSLWETVSAFANSDGGVIVLGVRETSDKSLRVNGLKNAGKMLEDFFNLANNPNKLSKNLFNDRNSYIERIGDKEVIVINVPRADRHDRPVYIGSDLFSGTYRRIHSGDYRCAKQEVMSMIADSTDEDEGMLIVEDKSLEAFNKSTISKYRMRYSSRHEGHAWNELSDEDFLIRIGAANKSSDGAVKPTRAGLLMFGQQWAIAHLYPGYILDYRQETDPDIRWSDRIVSTDPEWSGNVFDFFDYVYARLRMAIKLPFQLDDNSVRVDLTPAQEALREAIANCLANADYHSNCGVVFVWRPDFILLRNAGDFRVSLKQARRGGISDPRNATIMKIFSLVGISERAGSGIPDMIAKWEASGYIGPTLSVEYTPDSSNAVISEIALPLEAAPRHASANKYNNTDNKPTKESEDFQAKPQRPGNLTGKGIDNRTDNKLDDKKGQSLSISEASILRYLYFNPMATQQDVASAVGLSRSSVADYTAALQNRGLLGRTGSRRAGTWIVSDSALSLLRNDTN